MSLGRFPGGKYKTLGDEQDAIKLYFNDVMLISSHSHTNCPILLKIFTGMRRAKLA